MAYCPHGHTDMENKDSSTTEGQWCDVYKNETGLQPAFNRSLQAAQDMKDLVKNYDVVFMSHTPHFHGARMVPNC